MKNSQLITATLVLTAAGILLGSLSLVHAEGVEKNGAQAQPTTPAPSPSSPGSQAASQKEQAADLLAFLFAAAQRKAEESDPKAQTQPSRPHTNTTLSRIQHFPSCRVPRHTTATEGGIVWPYHSRYQPDSSLRPYKPRKDTTLSPIQRPTHVCWVLPHKVRPNGWDRSRRDAIFPGPAARGNENQACDNESAKPVPAAPAQGTDNTAPATTKPAPQPVENTSPTDAVISSPVKSATDGSEGLPATNGRLFTEGGRTWGEIWERNEAWAGQPEPSF